MGSSDAETQAKAGKTSGAQPAATNSSATPPAYPDWSGFQAYSPIPPHGFFPSPVASSPQAHPYMWGTQHIMAPYGTPPPPYVMYPPGGLYAHPSMPPGSHPFSPYAMPSPNGNVEVSGAVTSGAEVDGKSPEGKEKSPLKRTRGSLGSLNMITGKNNEPAKTSGPLANGVFSQSGESGSEASSEGSDANSQNDSQAKAGGGRESFEAETSQEGTAARDPQNGVSRAPSQSALNQTLPIIPMPAAAGTAGGVAGPTTNLNIGMDYWGAPAAAISPIRGKVPASTVSGAVVPGGFVGSRENVPTEMWLQQDERELKRQRRKQSNRESARRSRLRKQAECEELAQRVESLKDENTSLRAEVNQIRKEYEQLLAHNTSLKEKLGEQPRGTTDSRPDNNDKHADDDNHRKNSDSDAQPTQEDLVQSSH